MLNEIKNKPKNKQTEFPGHVTLECTRLHMKLKGLFFFQLYWGIIDISQSVTLRCTTYWFDIHLLQDGYHHSVSWHLHPIT